MSTINNCPDFNLYATQTFIAGDMLIWPASNSAGFYFCNISVDLVPGLDLCRGTSAALIARAPTSTRDAVAARRQSCPWCHSTAPEGIALPSRRTRVSTPQPDKPKALFVLPGSPAKAVLLATSTTSVASSASAPPEPTSNTPLLPRRHPPAPKTLLDPSRNRCPSPAPFSSLPASSLGVVSSCEQLQTQLFFGFAAGNNSPGSSRSSSTRNSVRMSAANRSTSLTPDGSPVLPGASTSRFSPYSLSFEASLVKQLDEAQKDVDEAKENLRNANANLSEAKASDRGGEAAATGNTATIPLDDLSKAEKALEWAKNKNLFNNCQEAFQSSLRSVEALARSVETSLRILVKSKERRYDLSKKVEDYDLFQSILNQLKIEQSTQPADWNLVSKRGAEITAFSWPNGQYEVQAYEKVLEYLNTVGPNVFFCRVTGVDIRLFLGAAQSLESWT
ncbi:hypothetical protein DFJ73DRAFT_958685 [Zopfochytrium polystomum]|nr:hypothetical protein DFJ73DRAFT_958685 [Zopfochytrium polystomum]